MHEEHSLKCLLVMTALGGLAHLIVEIRWDVYSFFPELLKCSIRIGVANVVI